ncbi:MAG: hypothetical protein GEV03_14185 [Streptosporangiales bacterium]|nr:hypothetical protein [Streptosporangiales bacterium]
MEMRGCLVDSLFVHVVTGRPIRVEAGIPLEHADPADPAGSVCAHGHVFASAEAAAGWLAENPEGDLGPIADAMRAAIAAKPYLVPPGH